MTKEQWSSLLELGWAIYTSLNIFLAYVGLLLGYVVGRKKW
jgi:hypothetical protein